MVVRTQAYCDFKSYQEIKSSLYKRQIMGKLTREQVDSTMDIIHTGTWIYVVTETYDNGNPEDYHSNDIGHFMSENAAKECMARSTDDMSAIQRGCLSYSYHKIPLF